MCPPVIILIFDRRKLQTKKRPFYRLKCKVQSVKYYTLHFTLHTCRRGPIWNKLVLTPGKPWTLVPGLAQGNKTLSQKFRDLKYERKNVCLKFFF